MKPSRLFKNVLTVGGWTLLSRILGMAREIMLYALIGVGPILDAFIVAFRLPNMFRRFFAEGAFNTAFVPLYTKKLEAGQDADDFASSAFSGLGLLLLVFTGLGLIFMPLLVLAFAGGFGGDERFDLSVDYGRVMFPYILLISLAALLSGVLNAKGRFAMAAATPVFLNIIIILALAAAWVFKASLITFLIWSIPLAGLVQLGLVYWAAKNAGLRLRLSLPSLSPDMRKLAKVALPAALANGVVQINLLVGQIVASFYPGAVSWLYGADRLYQLPLGVIGIAIGIVLLPELSRHVQSGDHTAERQAFSQASLISFALTFPASVALILVPYPLVSALFEHGMTGPSDIAAIALASSIYGLGLPAFILQKVLQPLYFARSDTKTPFRYAVIAMALNGALAVGLMPYLGWISPTIATTASSWLMVVLLYLGSRRFGTIAKLDQDARQKMLKSALAALLMGAILLLVQKSFGAAIDTSLLRIFYGVAFVFAGALLYTLLAQMIGAFKFSELKQSLRRG